MGEENLEKLAEIVEAISVLLHKMVYLVPLIGQGEEVVTPNDSVIKELAPFFTALFEEYLENLPEETDENVLGYFSLEDLTRLKVVFENYKPTITDRRTQKIIVLNEMFERAGFTSAS